MNNKKIFDFISLYWLTSNRPFPVLQMKNKISNDLNNTQIQVVIICPFIIKSARKFFVKKYERRVPSN